MTTSFRVACGEIRDVLIEEAGREGEGRDDSEEKVWMKSFSCGGDVEATQARFDFCCFRRAGFAAVVASI